MMIKPHEIRNLARQLDRFKNIMIGWQSEAPRYEGTIFKVLPFSNEKPEKEYQHLIGDIFVKDGILWTGVSSNSSCKQKTP